MKQMKTFILAAFALLLTAAATHAQGTVSPFFGYNDTVKTVTSKYLTLQIGSPGSVHVAFTYERISDTVNAVAYLEASATGAVNDYAKVPNTDTVIISSATTNKLWFIDPIDPKFYVMKYWRIRVTSSKANGQGKIRANLYK